MERGGYRYRYIYMISYYYAYPLYKATAPPAIVAELDVNVQLLITAYPLSHVEPM